MTDTITCPSCGANIAVSETLVTQIRQNLRQEFEREARQKDQELEQRRADIRQQELDLQASRQSLEQEIAIRVALESEKRSVQRLWAKREKQLERAAVNTAGLYGDLGGILGASLPPIANLEFTAIPADSDTPEMEHVAVAADDSLF